MVTDEDEALLEKAREKVLRLSEEEEWNVVIEVRLRSATKESEVFTARVESIDRYEPKQISEGKVVSVQQRAKADLGYEVQDGWESVVDHKELFGLPNPYFGAMFVHYSVEHLRSRGRSPLSVIVPEHQRLFVPILHRETMEEIRRANGRMLDAEARRDNNLVKYYQGEVGRLERMASVALEVLHAGKQFETLAQLQEGRTGQSKEGRNNRNKERI